MCARATSPIWLHCERGGHDYSMYQTFCHFWVSQALTLCIQCTRSAAGQKCDSQAARVWHSRLICPGRHTAHAPPPLRQLRGAQGDREAMCACRLLDMVHTTTLAWRHAGRAADTFLTSSHRCRLPPSRRGPQRSTRWRCICQGGGGGGSLMGTHKHIVLVACYRLVSVEVSRRVSLLH